MLKTAVSVFALGHADALKLVPPARPPPSLQDVSSSRDVITIDAPSSSSSVRWEAAPMTPALRSRPHYRPAVTHEQPLAQASHTPLESTKMLHRMAALTLHQMKMIQAQWLEGLVDSEGYDEDRRNEKWTAANLNILMEMTLINLSFNALISTEHGFRSAAASVQYSPPFNAASPTADVMSSLMEMIPMEYSAPPQDAAYELPLDQETKSSDQVMLSAPEGVSPFESLAPLQEHDSIMEPERGAATVAEVTAAEEAAAEVAAAEAAAAAAAAEHAESIETAAAAEAAAAEKAVEAAAATAAELVEMKKKLTPQTAPESEEVVPAVTHVNTAAVRASERAAARAVARQAAQLNVEAARAKAAEAEVEVLAARAAHAPQHRYRIMLDNSREETPEADIAVIPLVPDEIHHEGNNITKTTSVEEATATTDVVEVEEMAATSDTAEGDEATVGITTTTTTTTTTTDLGNSESIAASSIGAPHAVQLVEGQACEPTTATTAAAASAAAAGVLAAEVLAVEAALDAAVLMTHADRAIAEAEAQTKAAQARANEAHSQSLGLILELARLTSEPNPDPVAAAAAPAATLAAPAVSVASDALPSPKSMALPAPSPTKEEIRQKRVLLAQATKIAAAHKSVRSLEASLGTVQSQVKSLEDTLTSQQQASQLVEAREADLRTRIEKAEAAATAKVQAAEKRQTELEDKRAALEKETASLRSELAASSESRVKAEAAALAAEAKAENERVSAAQAVAAAAIESKAAAAEAAAAHALSSVAQAFQLHSELSKNSGSTSIAADTSASPLVSPPASATAASPAANAATSTTATSAAAVAVSDAPSRATAFSSPPPWEQRQSSYRLAGTQVHVNEEAEGHKAEDGTEEETLVEAAVSFLDVPWDSDAAFAVGSGARGVGRISNDREGARNAFSASRPRSMVGQKPRPIWQSYDNRFGVGRRSYLIDATLRSSG